MTIPFTIIDIEHITQLSDSEIWISSGSYSFAIPFPQIVNNNDKTNWLDGRLMHYGEKYRHQDWKEQRSLHVVALTNEEEEILRATYLNDIERFSNRITAASPRFIALCRFNGPQTVNMQLNTTTRAICLQIFELGESSSQWSCPGQHTFHYDCMLNVLRKQNQCPLCQYPVEALNLPVIDL